MRLVQVTAPEGQGPFVAQLALQHGVSSVSVHEVFAHGPNVLRDVIELQTSTPIANAFVESLQAARFYDPAEYSITVRDARTILIGGDEVAAITKPLPTPALDLIQELWQFTHITGGLVARVFIAALILATGIQTDQVLTMVAGLLFLPMLPGLMA